ncbi:MAG: FAD-dependent oxidoreductase [Pseudomonadota bacterium]
MSQEIYDTIVIGGGPAGAAAAVYVARKKMKSLMITEDFGGQSVVSSGIQNWIGEEIITGVELAEKLEKHVRAQEGMEIKMPGKVTAVTEKPDCTFEVTTNKGSIYRTKTLIVASGARRRRLNVPGEAKFEGRGVAFCSTCDALFFKDLDVAVVGSGNAALETVIDLMAYAKKIYLLIRGNEVKGDPVTQERVTQSPLVSMISNVEVQEVLGETMVTGRQYKNRKSGEIGTLAVDGVFVEVGSVPNSEFVKTLVETNDAGEIIVNHQTAQTSKTGIFAAGDVTRDPFKQNNIAAGDGVRSALSAYNYLLNIQKYSPCAEKGE